jgi:hypothetical protein
MANLWQQARRQALLVEPTDTELRDFLECYTAGYDRGVADVRKATRSEEWSVLIRDISQRLATDRSVVEAGCWLAGVRDGREDALADVAAEDNHLENRFCKSWDTARIADCALECKPTTLRLTKVVAKVWNLSDAPRVSERLARLSLKRQRVG